MFLGRLVNWERTWIWLSCSSKIFILRVGHRRLTRRDSQGRKAEIQRRRNKIWPAGGSLMEGRDADSRSFALACLGVIRKTQG